MIREQKIHDDAGDGFYQIFEGQDIEFINPIDYYSNLYIRPKISVEREFLLLRNFPFRGPLLEELLKKRALEAWDEKYKEILSTNVPPNFISLLSADSKKDQIRLLKSTKISLDELAAFIFRAWLDHGYSFSEYKAQHYHKGLDESTLPNVINVTDEKIESVGKTSMSQGQMKQVIEARTVIVSKFFDKGSSWHCFFCTYRSLRGEENWNGGTPHFHYISDKFGVLRENVVETLQRKEYKLNNLPHIELTGY